MDEKTVRRKPRSARRRYAHFDWQMAIPFALFLSLPLSGICFFLAYEYPDGGFSRPILFFLKVTWGFIWIPFFVFWIWIFYRRWKYRNDKINDD